MTKLWQHEDTGRMVWHENPGDRWFTLKTMYEDELPPMSDAEYSAWYDESMIVDGVRMGPNVKKIN